MNAVRKALYILLLALLATTCKAAVDPFVGTWVLDVASSQYPLGTCPESMIVEMNSAGSGVHYRSDTRYANGRILHSEYTADYDGNQALVMGAHGMMLPVFLKRIDSHSVVASYTKSLKIVATSERVVSADGRRMTITTIATNLPDQQVKIISVFNKQMSGD